MLTCKPASEATRNFSTTSDRISSRYAENSKKAAKEADPTAYPFVKALVVFPAESNLSVRSRTFSGWFDISIIPPALSVIGPNVSIARM